MNTSPYKHSILAVDYYVLNFLELRKFIRNMMVYIYEKLMQVMFLFLVIQVLKAPQTTASTQILILVSGWKTINVLSSAVEELPPQSSTINALHCVILRDFMVQM